MQTHRERERERESNRRKDDDVDGARNKKAMCIKQEQRDFNMMKRAPSNAHSFTHSLTHSCQESRLFLLVHMAKSFMNKKLFFGGASNYDITLVG